MGRIDTKQFHRLVEFLTRAGGVDKCLPYPDMTPVPPGFNEFASQDSQKQGNEWADVCPAYALALITARGYCLPESDSDMEILWDELGGSSTKLWPEVRDTIERSWSWLDAHHRPADGLH